MSLDADKAVDDPEVDDPDVLVQSPAEDMSDRECRASALNFAMMLYGASPDVLDHADRFAEFIMTGYFIPATRPPGTVVPFPEQPKTPA